MPEASPAPVPRLTVVVLSTLIGVAGMASLVLRFLPVQGGTRLVANLLVGGLIAALIGVVVARRSPSVQRFEAWLERKLQPPRRLEFTREGKYFVGVTFGVGFAAINTGNNLLYLLLGMMLSLIVASGVLSEMSLRDLEAVRLPPSRLHAGTPFLMGLSLRNRKRRLPSFSVEVEDRIAGHTLDKRCYFLKLPAGRKQQTSYRHTLPRRGRYRYTGFRLSTKFPFALFRKSRVVEAAGELVVLPELRPLPSLLPPGSNEVGDLTSDRRGRRGEFHGLREYRPGDDPRDVHWRSTARRGRPMVREHEDETARRLTVVIDNGLPGGEAHTDPAALEALERVVSCGASLAVHFVERGFAVRVESRGEVSAIAASRTQVGRLLRHLALLPTVDLEVRFLPPSGWARDTIFVGRRGSRRPGRAFGRVLEV